MHEPGSESAWEIEKNNGMSFRKNSCIEIFGQHLKEESPEEFESNL